MDQRVNEGIRVREVRVISPDGEQLGIRPTYEALEMARERGLDLVEVAPQARPPVCKIMDYNKWKYDQAKRLKEARKKQKVQDVKEVKMRPTIDDHDFNVKARACERFLGDGDKVKATIMFRGRELAHVDIGQRVLEKLLERVKDMCNVERAPKMEGRNMTMILSPKPQEAIRSTASETAGK
ncbi:MAG TPA: translation initiation factor IF-3 [Firmicutes bacterium]|jgi:translation initiation factor IF-3|nr:translation initiation factor IF-3 [Bacillota bacterium]